MHCKAPSAMGTDDKKLGLYTSASLLVHVSIEISSSHCVQIVNLIVNSLIRLAQFGLILTFLTPADRVLIAAVKRSHSDVRGLMQVHWLGIRLEWTGSRLRRTWALLGACAPIAWTQSVTGTLCWRPSSSPLCTWSTSQGNS